MSFKSLQFHSKLLYNQWHCAQENQCCGQQRSTWQGGWNMAKKQQPIRTVAPALHNHGDRESCEVCCSQGGKGSLAAETNVFVSVSQNHQRKQNTTLPESVAPHQTPGSPLQTKQNFIFLHLFFFLLRSPVCLSSGLAARTAKARKIHGLLAWVMSHFYCFYLTYILS